MAIKPRSYYLTSLGCAKNLVDSNLIAQELESLGYQSLDDPRHAEFLIVNTCGFIHDAREESLEALGSQAEGKKAGQYLLAAGCLSQRYQDQLLEEVPGLDGMIGTRDLRAILPLAEALREGKGNPGAQNTFLTPKILPMPGRGHFALQGSSAYLKIADGCRRQCAFCAIPQIKGTLVSRGSAEIIRDARTLQEQGILELNLIAQDVTDYGRDLGRNDGLADLLEEMLPQIPDIPWVRLLYTFPGSLTDRVIKLFGGDNQLLPYLDMPLQHASPEVLRSMHRPADMDWVRNTFTRLRAQVPNLVTRTTLIVGYPTETEADFELLCGFVEEMQFDHLGVFTFSPEQDTFSAQYGDPIPEEVKQERMQRIMALQAQISAQNLQKLIGQEFELLVEGQDPRQKVTVGRIFRDAPEIDGLVIASGLARPGKMARVRITAASEHDLYGKILKH